MKKFKEMSETYQTTARMRNRDPAYKREMIEVVIKMNDCGALLTHVLTVPAGRSGAIHT